MTARSAATIASLALLAVVSGCTSFFEVPIETPLSPKMDVSAFRRVLVAGFISGGTDDVDANLETVRLLRSQLRTKSGLRVIEADVLPLAELAADKAKTAPPSGSGPSESTDTGANGNLPKVASDVQTMAPAAQAPAAQAPAVSQNTEPAAAKIRNAKDLEKYQSIFADVAFWKKIGEEYENPLIVTGTVLFTPQQTAGFVTRNVEQYDQLGRRTVVPQRLYMERKGFAITPKFIFIDGRTGATLHTESLHEEILYSSQQNTPALSSYFELMDKVIPVFLGTLSTQKIRGTRVLLR
jgi:predicted flap endonuclease-1-like 5' DNA nuclease